MVKKRRITLIGSLCKGCGYCVEFCPNKVFERSEEMNDKGIKLPKIKDMDKCTLCGLCTRLCPDFALTIKEDEEDD